MLRAAVERVARPTRHHLASSFFANLSSLCAIWHALGKPSHDRPTALPRRSLLTSQLRSRSLVRGDVVSWERRFLIMARHDGALPDLSRFAAARWPRGSACDQIVRTRRIGSYVDEETNRHQPTVSPQFVSATSIAAGRRKWNPLVERNWICRNRTPRCTPFAA